MLTALKIAAINCFLFVLILAGTETYLYFADPQREYGRNDFANFTWGVPVVNNRYGFRERDFIVPKPDGLRRIMVIGDSLTWGAGLRPEERYTAVMERELPGVEVLNFGAPGGDMAQNAGTLRWLLPKVQPDRIVIGFCVNDVVLNYMWTPEIADFQADHWLWFEGIELLRLALPRTATAANKATYNIAKARGRIPAWEEVLAKAYMRKSPDWIRFVRALQEIRSLSDSAGLPAPIFASLYNNADSLPQHRQAEEEAGRIGFQVVTFDATIEKYAGSRVINPHDGHPSAGLNTIYGRGLAEKVR